MKKLACYVFGIFLLLGLITGCKQKRVESTTYGDFRYEVINWERKKLFWPGNDHISSEHRIFYKGEEIDFEKMATEYLKEKTDYMESLELRAAHPSFYHRDSALYIELDAGEHTTIGVLTLRHHEPVFIPLINMSTEEKFALPTYFSFYQMDSIGNQKVLMTNYLIHEQPFRVLAKFDRIVRKYDNFTGDTTAACEADRYYGMSPDEKLMVRSYVKDMLGYRELGCLFVTEINTGKTSELAVMKGDSALVDFYNVHPDSSCQIWFRKNFEWLPEGNSYRLAIKH